MKNYLIAILLYSFISNQLSAQDKDHLSLVTSLQGYLFSIDSCNLVFQQTKSNNDSFLECLGQSAFCISNAQVSEGINSLFQIGIPLEIEYISDNCLTNNTKSKLSYSFVEIELIINLSNDGFYPINTTKDYFLKFSYHSKIYNCSQLNFNCSIKKLHFYNSIDQQQFISRMGQYSNASEYFLY